jgi:hypothetical protein
VLEEMGRFLLMADTLRPRRAKAAADEYVMIGFAHGSVDG